MTDTSTTAEKPEANPRGWHVQIGEGEWVLWGYGPRQGSAHVDRATTVIYFDDMEPMEFPFELPSPVAGLDEPQEYGRRRGWGWRLRHNGLRVDTRWQIADSREQALADARAYALSKSKPGEARLMAALDDVREGLGGLW